MIGLIAYAPEVKQFRAHHWVTAIATTIAVVIFFVMLAGSFSYAGRKIEPKLQRIESTGPP
jgi:cytochrome b subunit of formate dehydrogenase